MSRPPLQPATDPAHDVLGAGRHALDPIFAPKTVAVIGASEQPGSVGRTILWNLLSNPFGGTVFPVNARRRSVLGITAYPSIDAVPAPVDLAVIATPAASVPGIIAQCADSGVPAAIIISAGFKEVGVAGVELEAEILAHARRGKMRLIGPNCLGVMNPVSGLNATFASAMARPGNVGFISQSGALCTAILDWSLRELVGFSAFVSIGSMLDVGWGDLIDYLGNDPQTESIVMYMESIGDARAFLSAAREVALSKPIIVIKAGRTEAAAKAAASHTGTLAGSDAALDAAFRRCGVTRVHTIADLFYMAEVLARQPRPRGPRLSILTNAGGPGVLATDALISNGGTLAPLAAETVTHLNAFLPPHWSHGNPVDILGDADPARYVTALRTVAADPNTDGLLVILTPQGMTDPTQTAEQIKAHARIEGKPVLASWMGGLDVAAGEAILNHAGIATFAYPDTAARLFTQMWRYSENLRGLYETPSLPGAAGHDAAAGARAAEIIATARRAGRTLLTEIESKALLAAYDIPTVATQLALTEDEAVARARALGYPVVLKLHSETITHKTDVGGVQLNLGDDETVRTAFRSIRSAVTDRAGAQHFLGVTVQPMIELDGYELILGSSLDSQFGPILLFGAGGHLVEVVRDSVLGLPPLTTTLARRMLEQTRIFTGLKGVRGRRPVDLASLESLMVRFSQLVAEQRWIKEIDINPLLASSDRLVALDARVVIHGAEVVESDIPPLAIRPYPTRYVAPWSMNDGTPVLIRPIRPEDEGLMIRFHETLSPQTIYSRYFHMISLGQRIAHERLVRICFIDYDREMALVAEGAEPETGAPAILAVGRLSKIRGSNEAEFAILVNDRFQGRGLGTELLRRLLQICRDEGIRRVRADILANNDAMQRISARLGFSLSSAAGSETVSATLDLIEQPGRVATHD